MAGDGTTVVNTEKIMEAAKGIYKDGTEFQSHLESMKRWLSITDVYWAGDAASLYTKRLESLISSITVKFEDLATTPRELAEYAETYGQADKVASAAAMQLVIDVSGIIQDADWASL